MKITAPNQVWVSDITYIRVIFGFMYLTLITDAFSRKIVGYHLALTMTAEDTLLALEMALKKLPEGVRQGQKLPQYEHKTTMKNSQKSDNFKSGLDRALGIFFPMPYALCPMLHAPCPLPYAKQNVGLRPTCC